MTICKKKVDIVLKEFTASVITLDECVYDCKAVLIISMAVDVHHHIYPISGLIAHFSLRL